MKRLYFYPMKKTAFIILTFLSLVIQVSAQRNVRDSIIGTPWVAANYGASFPSGDLIDRFGYLNHLGILAGYKTTKNWFFGIDGNFMFGKKINLDDPLTHLRDSKGNITDQNGDVAGVLFFSRGFNLNATVGKVIPIFGSNKNSGLFIQAGAGYLAYKLRIETQDHVVPQIELDYKKGYDRLTVGLNTHQFLGYAFMANRGFVNFYGGFYIQEGFTRNARDIFYDQPNTPVSKDLRLDLQYGLKLGWFIPIYKRLPKEFYYD
ncbi:MAG: hypothetical protein ACI9XP_000514 [Lentimonas sp.]|jgi:hypothetical protein